MTYVRKIELTKKQLEILEAIIHEGSVFIPGEAGPRVSQKQAISYHEKQASILSSLSHEGTVIIEVRR